MQNFAQNTRDIQLGDAVQEIDYKTGAISPLGTICFISGNIAFYQDGSDPTKCKNPSTKQGYRVTEEQPLFDLDKSFIWRFRVHTLAHTGEQYEYNTLQKWS